MLPTTSPAVRVWARDVYKRQAFKRELDKISDRKEEIVEAAIKPAMKVVLKSDSELLDEVMVEMCIRDRFLCGFLAHTRTAGDVVGSITHQSQHVDDLLGGLYVEPVSYTHLQNPYG